MIQRLKESVEAKFGRKIAYQKDCISLSDSVFKLTSEILSPSTLRRFFGFLSTNSNPSRATLDILSVYCGYNNWESFKDNNSVSHSTEPIIDLWEKAKTEANAISEKNCKSLKQENSLGFSNSIAREFAHDRLESFLNTSYSATPFIGPGGFGKTTLLIKWYEDFKANARSENHIILFIPAIHLENWVSKENYLDDWILSLLNLSQSGFFETLNSNPNLALGKFILIIDALDEIEANLAKTERIFNALHKLTASLSSQWFRLITSARFSTWVQFTNLANNIDTWYFASPDKIFTQGTNMPPLSDNEIQSIIDLTINSGSLPRMIIEEIPYDLLQIISHPYYLQLFIEIYNPTSLHLISDKIDLLTEFLKKHIYQSNLADEKSDILYAIVELSHQEKTYGLVKKNDLKERYPIHLKSVGNYATAYNQLLSFGILSEEITKNEYGQYTTYTKVNQRILFRMLLAHKLIEKNNGITFELFTTIEKEYSGSLILGHLINLIFELAYKRKSVDALKPFFNLKDESLDQAFRFPNIHNALAKDELMRRELIPYYASNARARKFLFERHINLNTIANSSRLLYFNYIQNSTTEKDIFVGKTLLYTSSAYSMDFTWVNQFGADFPMDVPHHGTSPIIAGLWFTCRFIVAFVGGTKDYDVILKHIDFYQAIHQSEWNINDRYNYEIGLFLGLLTTKQYEVIRNRINPLLMEQSHDMMNQEEKALTLYLELAQWHINKTLDDLTAQRILQHMDNTPEWARYQSAIVGKSWMAMYYFTRGHIEKSYEYFKKALEISNVAGYTIYEAKLLYSLSKVLESIGESQRANDCNKLIETLTDRSNIDLGSL